MAKINLFLFKSRKNNIDELKETNNSVQKLNSQMILGESIWNGEDFISA